MTNFLLFTGAFLFMEFVAWSNHKYIMHGVLWSWHKDHHQNDHKRRSELSETKGFERNDLFFLVYAIPGIAFMIFGFMNQLSWALALAFGITLYGLIYFLIHDVLIHRRLISKARKPRSKYLKALVKAHEAHHHGRNKKDFNNYGLLIFQLRFFKA